MDIMDLHELDKRLTSHEAVCEERWRETLSAISRTQSRIQRVEMILISSSGAMLLTQLLRLQKIFQPYMAT